MSDKYNQFPEARETALAYATKGWPVFPVASNKLPAIKCWEKSSTTDPQQIDTWYGETFIGGCNFGFTPGPAGIAVIDTDVNKTIKGEDGNPQKVNGEESLRNWLHEKGITLPQTFRVQTPSGGFHRYFKAPGLRSKNAFLPAVDVKSGGGYVIIPGSKSAKGSYKVVDNLPVAELPAEFIREYGRFQKQKSELGRDISYKTHVTPDTAEKLVRATEIITDWPEAEEGERNDQLFQLMRELCKAGISRQKAKEMYADLGLDKIGLDPESYEVTATIKSAYGDLSDLGSESEEERKSSLRLLDDLPPLPDKGEQGKRFSDAGGFDWNDLLKRHVPERRWFLEGWLSADEGYTVLFSGRGGTGKSALMLDLLYALATGTPFLGKQVLRGSKAMYVSCEDSAEEITRRIQSRKLDADVPNSIIRIWPRSGYDNILCIPDKRGVLQSTPFMAELQSRGRDFFGMDGGVLVLDTLSDIFAGNENDRSQVSQFVKLHLNKLGRDLGVTIIVLAHPAKGTSSTGQGFSGSTAWEGAFRCRWELNYQKADKIDGLVELVLAKSNAAKAGEKITLSNAGGMFQVVDAAKADESVKELLVQMIDEAYRDGNAFGRSKQAVRPIETARVIDPVTGLPLSADEINKIVMELISEQRVVSDRISGGQRVLKSNDKEGVVND